MGEPHGAFGRLTFGTPPSPSVELRPPTVATVRQASAYGSELCIRGPDGAPITLPLNEDQLLRLADEGHVGAAAGAHRAAHQRRDPMNGSGIFRLGWADLARGLVLAVLTAVLTSCQQAIDAGDLDPTAWDWRAIGGVTLAAVIAYLLKNLVSDGQGRVLGRIGALLLVLAGGAALGGCSSLMSGLAIGGAEGVDGPGAAAVRVVHGDPRLCGDLAAQGSIPLVGVTLDCSVTAAGDRRETASIHSADPSSVLLKGLEAQAQQAVAMAGLLQQLVPLVAQAAATAAAGPAAGAAAGLVVKPPAPAVPAGAGAPPALPR